MQAIFQMVTPELAAKWLAQNAHNRPIRPGHVRFLADQMRAGEWRHNGSTIVRNGSNLLDGQHRLLAIVDSGVAVESLVVEGADSTVFDTIDTGLRRSAGDTLAVRGEKYLNLLAPALRRIQSYARGMTDVAVSRTNASVIATLELYPDMREWARIVDGNPRLRNPFGSTLLALLTLFARVDSDAATQFAMDLESGLGMSSTDPVYLLRERMIDVSRQRGRLAHGDMAALIIKAWNARLDGTPIKRLNFCRTGANPESFPTIRGLGAESAPQYAMKVGGVSAVHKGRGRKFGVKTGGMAA